VHCVRCAPRWYEGFLTSKAQWAIAAGIVALGAVGLLYATNVIGGGIPPVEAGSAAPPFRAATTVAGANVREKSLADYKGQVVLLNLWATWCGPCRSEMPSLERLQQELGPKGLKIVAVSVDNPGMEDAIRDFRKEFGLTFEILYAPDGKIRDDYQATGFPETFIIGRDGVIRKRVIAATDWSAEPQKALLRQLLAEPGS
jgi:cytochrome c biogenesis protein CcmG, thiol:disulfide interchange protein DsbE